MSPTLYAVGATHSNRTYHSSNDEKHFSITLTRHTRHTFVAVVVVAHTFFPFASVSYKVKHSVAWLGTPKSNSNHTPTQHTYIYIYISYCRRCYSLITAQRTLRTRMGANKKSGQRQRQTAFVDFFVVVALTIWANDQQF